MSGKGGRSDDAGAASQSQGPDNARSDRDYGDSAGYGGGGAALDYDDVLAGTGSERKLANNPLDEVIADRSGASEEQIRELAYSKWEQAGRPEGHEDEFWREAEAELHRS